jgi:adenine-specific DNA-methyltransferase
LGAYDLKEDFPDEGKVFTNPKPVRLFTTFFPFLLKKDGDQVLDFFAGSGSTAKAIYALNAKDSIRRSYVLCQLPEPLDGNDKDQKIPAKFCDKIGKPRNIAELTKERLRRAGKKIREEWEAKQSTEKSKDAELDLEGNLESEISNRQCPDLGFRVFKLDSTNIREWDPNRENLATSLEASVDHLKSNRSEQDILFELLLKLGLDLCVPMEERTIAGKTVHSIGAGVLITCLDKSIARADAEPLAQGIFAWRKELKTAGDSTLVFRDSAFADDVAKTNLSKILEQNGIAAKNIRSL